MVQHFLFGSLISIDRSGEVTDPNLLEADEASRHADGKSTKMEQSKTAQQPSVATVSP